jgi:hypothetical protein
MADPRVRPRKEYKAAQEWARTVEPDTLEGVAREDAVREGEAHRDLLDLAATEVKARVDAEDRTKRARLQEDEELLTMLGNVLKAYAALIVTAFVLPPATLAPFGAYCGFGGFAAAFGFAKMFGALSQVEGRAWLILQDRVDQVLQRIRMAHVGAAGAVLLSVLWVVIALLADQVPGG